MTVILRYFSEFGRFLGTLHKSGKVEDTPKLSATEM